MEMSLTCPLLFFGGFCTGICRIMLEKSVLDMFSVLRYGGEFLKLKYSCNLTTTDGAVKSIDINMADVYGLHAHFVVQVQKSVLIEFFALHKEDEQKQQWLFFLIRMSLHMRQYSRTRPPPLAKFTEQDRKAIFSAAYSGKYHKNLISYQGLIPTANHLPKDPFPSPKLQPLSADEKVLYEFLNSHDEGHSTEVPMKNTNLKSVKLAPERQIDWTKIDDEKKQLLQEKEQAKQERKNNPMEKTKRKRGPGKEERNRKKNKNKNTVTAPTMTAPTMTAEAIQKRNNRLVTCQRVRTEAEKQHEKECEDGNISLGNDSFATAQSLATGGKQNNDGNGDEEKSEIDDDKQEVSSVSGHEMESDSDGNSDNCSDSDSDNDSESGSDSDSDSQGNMRMKMGGNKTKKYMKHQKSVKSKRVDGGAVNDACEPASKKPKLNSNGACCIDANVICPMIHAVLPILREPMKQRCSHPRSHILKNVTGTAVLNMTQYDFGVQFDEYFPQKLKTMAAQETKYPQLLKSMKETNRCFFLHAGRSLGLNPFAFMQACRTKSWERTEQDQNEEVDLDVKKLHHDLMIHSAFVDALTLLKQMWFEELEKFRIVIVWDNKVADGSMMPGGVVLQSTNDAEIIVLHYSGTHYTWLQPIGDGGREKLKKVTDELIEAEQWGVVQCPPLNESIEQILNDYLSKETEVTWMDEESSILTHVSIAPRQLLEEVSWEEFSSQGIQDDLTTMVEKLVTIVFAPNKGWLSNITKNHQRCLLGKFNLKNAITLVWKVWNLARQPNTAVWEAANLITHPCGKETEEVAFVTFLDTLMEITPEKGKIAIQKMVENWKRNLEEEVNLESGIGEILTLASNSATLFTKSNLWCLSINMSDDAKMDDQSMYTLQTKLGARWRDELHQQANFFLIVVDNDELWLQNATIGKRDTMEIKNGIEHIVDMLLLYNSN